MRGYRVEPYAVAAWIAPALEALRPRERLTVSAWAEKYRVLPDGNAIPGPWRNSVTPYLTEIMDAFSDDGIEKIVFVKPTQVGGTSAMENMLGCLIDQEPAPTMVVYPSDDLAERTVDAKLEPMIRSCAPLVAQYRKNASKKLQLKFGAMTVYLNGANSPADLASTNIRYLFLDEVDKYPGASKKEADPVSLAIERTKTYTTNRKIFITSTPTLRTGHIWRAKEEADAEKHYFVPCPHCGKYIELKFSQLKWPSKEVVPEPSQRAEMTNYECQECKCLISDREKGRMLAEGRWQAMPGSAARPKSVAYWLSTLYSPFTRFSDIAAEFMRSKEDPEKLQNFVNSWLGEPWEDTQLKTSSDTVLARQTKAPEFVVPDWAELLTGGVDVQETCLYWTIRAWGKDMTSQCIAHGQAIGWGQVDRIMNLEYGKADGQTKMLVDLCLVDSGDQTEDVYDFCSTREWALPCKGTANAYAHYRISTVNRTDSKGYGMQLVLVDGGRYKDMIAARMRKDNGPGSWMVHAECDREYAEQVTAEHKVRDKNGKVVWMLKHSHADNHYLDCEVYAAAAADVLGVRGLHMAETAPEPEPEPRPVRGQTPTAEVDAPEMAWIDVNENWLGG